jgi:hypothetical protein
MTRYDMLFKYNVFQLAALYSAATRENLIMDPKTENSGTQVIGDAFATLYLMLIISLVIWVVGLVLISVHWKEMPTWALVVGVIGLFVPGGPIVTIVLALVARK